MSQVTPETGGAAAPGDSSLVLDSASLAQASDTLLDVQPWCGFAPIGRYRNFLGAVMPDERDPPGNPDFDEMEFRTTELPTPLAGEAFFEFASLINSVKEARNRFVAVSLGAHDGRPLVNAARAIQSINPMPFKLVGVEGDRHMCEKLRRHFVNNGIDPDDHCIINTIVSDTNRPRIFTTSEVRTGANIAFHDIRRPEQMFEVVRQNDLCETVLKTLLTRQSTGLHVPLHGTDGVSGELEMVSALTVADILAPFDRVDYLEVDIQSSEGVALPPAMDALSKTVRWLHLGTHGGELHRAMATLFANCGWQIHTDILPESRYHSAAGTFTTQDGVLVARNPRV